MGSETKMKIGLVAILAAVLFFVVSQQFRIRKLTEERDQYRSNTEILLDTVHTYHTRDSLSAAQVESLTLALSEYKKFRAEDAALIRTLKARNRELQEINATQAQTIIDLQSAPRDTVIIKDSLEVKAKIVSCGDEWYDFEGLLTEDSFQGKLKNRDALLITESVKYKRFLGFLWKTGIKNRKVDVVSKNPHTTILSIEHVTIKN